MARANWRQLRGPDETLTAQPGDTSADLAQMPGRQVSPGRLIYRRVLLALAALFISTFCVYFDRDGYSDVQGDRLTFLDCLYYSAVTLSTTGYGDITPVTEFSRLINIVVITPLRVAFLILLVGTTFEAFTESSRQAFKLKRWRNTVRDHTVVIGYGTKGKTAIDAMLGDGIAPDKIAILDTEEAAVKRADAAGLVARQGDATRADVLRREVSAERAAAIVVAVDDDATAVLVTLTAREIAPGAKIVASIREAENQHLLKQSGANSVVVSSETAGRLLGIATSTPRVVEMLEDLMTPDAGLAVAEREVEQSEIGGSPRHLRDIVLGVVRGDQLLRVGTPEVDAVEAGDRLLYVRNVKS